MFDVQNIYNSAPPSGPHKRGVQRPRRVILFDLKRPGAPRELTDHGNVPHPRMPPTGAPITTDVGNSQFYAKYGIRPIHDSAENMPDSSTTTQASKMTRLYDDNIKFPKLEDCAHFHYDVVELNQIHVVLSDDNQENVYRPADANGLPEVSFFLCVRCSDKSWTVRRTFSDLCTFDKQLHRCIYDRNYSLLRELQPQADIGEDDIPELRKTMAVYLHRFSAIAGSMINCGPILSWLEMDNRGNRLIVTDDSAINTPAVAAAHAIRRYSAKALDEISFEVGDIISIIDMPPSDESSWWRGKRGFEVGFFPSDTVEVISEKVPQSVSSKIPQTPVKPVLRKRGKLISFLRTFFTSRPTRTTLKRTGIMKERVFGCDLGEHLLNTGHDVPLVLKSCAEVIEAEGIVDGIYRLSGVASNIQRLRNEFDEDRVPDLEAEVYQQDIHSVSSLVKMYFRELPNPLLTYQLYDKFAEAVHDEDTKLAKLHDVIQQLPPPHYRTAEYLLRHLSAIAAHGVRTGMHCKNLAIVWAPNLLRSKELEQSCSTAALQGVGIQAIVTECLIAYVDVLFNSSLHAAGVDPSGRARPKSLAISTPTRLLSLEEARERAMTIGANRGSPKQKYIDVGGGSATLPTQYHTVIDLPNKKKRKKSPNSSTSGWRGLFNRGKAPPGRGRSRNLSSDTSEAMKDTGVVLDDDVSKRRRLRPVRSCDSLISAATTPVKHSAGRVIPRPVIDGASGPGLRSQSCDTSYDYELEYRDDSPLNDEEVFTQPRSRQPFPSNVFSHDTSAVTIVMASDATAPKTNFMSELEEKLHSRSASIDSRSQWRPDRSHTDLVTSAEEPDIPEVCHSLPENFALQSLPSPTPAPRSNLPTPSGARPTSYDNIIYDVPKDLFAQRLPGDAHVMRPSSAWAHENLGSPVDRDTPNATDAVCVLDRNPSGGGTQTQSSVHRDDDMHVSGVEGAACELALYEESVTDDIFHANSAANTDSESEFERREAPSSSDDFSTDIFTCLEKRCREVTKETLFKVQPDVATPIEGATAPFAPVYVKDQSVSDSHSVNVTSGHLSPVTPTNASEQLMVQERIADPTEYVTCVEVTADEFETVDIIPCVSDMSKSSDDNMTPASDMSKSLESMLEEAGGGSLYTLAESAESCTSDTASVTLGAATSQCHDSSSSIDSEIRAAVQLHEDMLHSSPPGLDDAPRVFIGGVESPANDDPIVGSTDRNEADMGCHAAEMGTTLVGTECMSSSATVGATQEILDGYLYVGGSQIELFRQ
ncbi:hypothetical protein NP493_50g04042 [Ridgeia piscesae]|uniref:Uncharacterized protein n=1 Tax=Ridgeia piscesae TaxID=27915 RepID=A0AAD9UJJ9_RIDPI|nr:hypothetical protein NP493_50g04042 [Ridgeia piscesae]